MVYMPFENTTIPAQRSMMEIQGMLEMVGFDRIANISDGGERKIIAQYKSASFQFSINISDIVTALIRNSSTSRQRDIRIKSERGKEILANFAERASKIGWRYLAGHIKNICDGIKLGVISPSDALAGYAILGLDNDRRAITLAQVLTTQIEEGMKLSPDMLMLPERT